MRGKATTPGTNLVPFNSKVKEETKVLCDALVKVQGLEGTRTLLEIMLNDYEKKNPDLFETAREYIETMQKLTIYNK